MKEKRAADAKAEEKKLAADDDEKKPSAGAEDRGEVVEIGYY